MLRADKIDSLANCEKEATCTKGMSRPDVMSIHSHWQMSSANAQPRNVWSHWDDVYTIATTPDR